MVAWKGGREKQHASIVGGGVWATRVSRLTHSLGTSHSALPYHVVLHHKKGYLDIGVVHWGFSVLPFLSAKSSLVAWKQEFDSQLGW